MPFTTLPQTTDGLEAYPLSMPKPLVVAVLDRQSEKEGRTTAIVTYGFAYAHPASGARMEVPAGYITDFASIPAPVRGVFPPFGRHAKAAVLHDWLYLIGEPGQKPFADRVFLDAMEELGVSWARRNAMYKAVQIGGGGGYRREWRSWREAFGDWRTGDRLNPNTERTDHYQAKWPAAPNPGYKP